MATAERFGPWLTEAGNELRIIRLDLTPELAAAELQALLDSPQAAAPLLIG